MYYLATFQFVINFPNKLPKLWNGIMSVI